MADVVHRAGRGPGLLIGALALAACSATPAPTSTPPAHPTAVAACTDGLRSMDVPGSGWQVAVEVARADSSALALVSGDSIATCQTGKNAERTSFDNTASGVGTYPTSSPPALSYLTSAGPAGETSFLVGRVPPTAGAVRVAFADGSEQEAVLGGGLWLVWLEQPADAVPVAIEALDAAGSVISRLADTDGIQPAP
jgi:hypothetical protein